MIDKLLGFIHLNVNKKQGKLRQTLGREAAYADPTKRLYHDLGELCEFVFGSDLETREAVVDGSDPFSS